MSPRDNSLSTSPVNNPTVYTISAAAGINALRQSRDYDHEGGRRHFFMHVVSDGGAIDISASPQIVAGLQGDVLTLRGTSNTDTIKIEDSAGLHMIGDKFIVLGEGDSITFVYNETGTISYTGWGEGNWGLDYGYSTSSGGWIECSRYKGGL